MSSAATLRTTTWSAPCAWARRACLAVFTATLVFASGVTTSARAQVAEPSAADRQAAGQAYDRATAAYLARDYVRAATLFETAYRLAPASAPLVQAVRSHERAGNGLRAATLALRLEAFFPDDDAARRQAEQTLATTRGQFLRIDASCVGECTLELDGVLQEHSSFFAAPGAAHTVRASFETGPVEREVSGAAGAVERVSFEAPVAVAHVEPIGEDVPADAQATEPSPQSGAGLTPIVFVVSLVATAAVGGVLIWSGIDTLDGVPAYQAMPTADRLREGQYRELRTNVLIGVTGALALTTLVLALVTDWDGDSDERAPEVSFFVTPEAGMASVGGRF